ncbi:hypothetical protein BLOT_013107 [Blomia tropicalis]|nr:hypothetical protein BLOT_013107 [Blomia tropicalis]
MNYVMFMATLALFAYPLHLCYFPTQNLVSAASGEEDENESGQSRETESLLGPLSSTPSPTTVSVSIEQEIDNTPQYEDI